MLFVLARHCPDGENYWPCKCDEGIFIQSEVFCRNIATSDISKVFLKNSPVDLISFTLIGNENGDQLNIPSHLLASHTSALLNIECCSSPDEEYINSVKFRPKITIEPDAFSSTSKKTESLLLFNCDLGSLDFLFLSGFDQLARIRIRRSFNIGKANWHSLPPLPALQNLCIEDDQLHPNNSWADNLPSLINGIEELSLIGVGFSGDETAERILQWIHQSSAETLTDVELINWSKLTRIPRWLSFFRKLERLEIICDNFEIQVMEENSIVFNAPIRRFALQNCGVREIKPDAFQGICQQQIFIGLILITRS